MKGEKKYSHIQKKKHKKKQQISEKVIPFPRNDITLDKMVASRYVTF